MPRLRPLAPLLALACAGAVVAAPAPADAFCGFYVSGADSQLVNNATVVVLMRDGTRTVLSMQNNYDGPPQDFAMVVPVPVVLQEKDVKTLPHAIFDRVDLLAAPRLVEYWEQDPCMPMYDEAEMAAVDEEDEAPMRSAGLKRDRDLGVTIEAQFEVGEYQIVVLSARDSTGLDTWLRANKYSIPPNSEPLLRPYVQGGMKFFVAKVNINKVKRENGRAMLSPLRFHYDSPTFSLPVRLGLINSGGAQDLLVHVLARGVRYEVANYPNVAIPTNLEVSDSTRRSFGQFYAALFDRVTERNPGAVITEYAWAAGSCDPCPQEPLNAGELATLGADVLPTYEGALAGGKVPSSMQWQMPSEFVLTRLHARYGRDSLGEDLVFQAAPPIVGGRETYVAEGRIEQGAAPSQYGDNNFQARYIIRHPWTGPIECENPQRGMWGGPPPGWQGESGPAIATDLAFVPRGADLATFLAEDVPELEMTAAPALPAGPLQPPPPDPRPSAQGGCSRCSVDGAGSAGGLGFLGLAAGIGLWLRRRRS
jgi:MYXO-CTERM domain-containing protein